jgi:hypothetical protein
MPCVVDQRVEAARLAVHPSEGLPHRGGRGHVADDVRDPRAGSRRLSEVEREDPEAVRRKPLRHRLADAAGGAGDDGHPLPIAAHAEPPQYISQPPLTLIVAPVT